MAAARQASTIVISDDQDNNASARKRHLEDEVLEKVQWTDDSDNGAPSKPVKKRTKRKPAGKRKSGAARLDGPADNHDDFEDSGVPHYLVDRRREFDENKKKHHDAALMLPPDYTGVGLNDADPSTLRTLAERPQFPPSSGVKPSRPYKDIDLPRSAGLVPASIAQYLRDYQVTGVGFLHHKFVHQEGAILGDDMGLGKTVQVAAFLTAAFGKTGDERDSSCLRQIRRLGNRWYPRALIVCPGSLIMNWKSEMERWGWWHMDIFHGSGKSDVLDTARAGMLEIMITTYDTYKNHKDSINLVQWDVVIADECHRLKDLAAATTKAMQEVNALCRIGLTGTAIQNKYEELWTLLNWTNPGNFGSRAEWSHAVSKPLTVGQSHEATVTQLSLARQTAQKLVQNLLPRFFLRRMKALIADQLPRKTDRVVFCPLTEVQRTAYENFLASDDAKFLREASDICPHGSKKGWCCQKVLPSGKHWHELIFPSMILLQKMANHLTLLAPDVGDSIEKRQEKSKLLQTCLPRCWKELAFHSAEILTLMDPEYCGKWKILKKLLKFWHGNGDKVLVFSHSVRLLRILHLLFNSTHYNVSYLDGSLSYEERQNVVDTFNTDPTQFCFLISTKAGGVGLNITSANKVVIVDPHWNPSYDLQAQDRAYRIGQTRDVEVFRLISVGTIEEIVYARQIYKQQQANIGYTASSERRYFKGVQTDTQRKGEIFGLVNIFTYHSESGLLRDIVNKTNIAEAKVGVNLAEVDIEQAAQDDEADGIVKKEAEDDEDGGLNSLATLLAAENQEQVLESRRAAAPKTDAVQALLAASGVNYMHENSEVIGSSKVEEQLSRQAAMMSHATHNPAGEIALFPESQSTAPSVSSLHSVYNPPEDVQLRQFCEIARDFGFRATEFALAVEGWTQENRRDCLDAFYKKRAQRLQREGAVTRVMDGGPADEGVIKEEEKWDETEVSQEDMDADTDAEDDHELEAERTQARITANTRRGPPARAFGSHFEESGVVAHIKREASPSEGLASGSRDQHSEDIRKEDIMIKDEIKMRKDEANLKLENIPPLRMEGSSKRISIFLSDDDEDDEL